MRYSLTWLLAMLGACAAGGHSAEPAPDAQQQLPFVLTLPPDCRGRPMRGAASRAGEWRCGGFALRYDWGARNIVGTEFRLPEGIAPDTTWNEALGGRPAQVAVYDVPIDIFGLDAVWPEADSVELFDGTFPASLHVWVEARSPSGRNEALAALRQIRWQSSRIRSRGVISGDCDSAGEYLSGCNR